ncbi:MAG: DUF3352 domain-containing protein [Phormidesmis sp.]
MPESQKEQTADSLEHDRSKTQLKTATPTEESEVETVSTSKFALRLPKAWPKLAGLAAVILLGGGAIAALNFSQRSPRSLSPAGAQLVPQDALATITLTTDEIAWNKLRQFGTADSQTQFDQLLTTWKDQLFTLNGYSFKRDINPWIGDRITLAFLPTAESEAQGLSAATQNIVLIAPIADPVKAKSLLQSGPQRSSVTWEDRSYKKIPIKTIQTDDGQSIEAAVIGTDWLLLSNTAAGVEQAIDTYRGKRSLRDNAGYRSATAALSDPQPLGKSFAQLYLNIPAATEALKTPEGTATDRQGSLIPLQGSQGIVATALVESEGIRFLGTSWLLPKNDLVYGELSNEADNMSRRLPSDTLLALSGSNLQQTWQALSEGNVSLPFFPDAQNLRAGLLTQTGLDIEEDIMPWAGGEFAFGLLKPVANPTEAEAEQEAEQKETEQNGVDSSEAIASAPLLLMVQTNDRTTAESVWAQIDDVMINRYRYQVETTDLPEGSVTRWISPFQGVQFSHGWLPGNVTFFAVGSDITEALIPAPTPPLASTRLFQTLTSEAPTSNNGQFFLDLAKINQTDGVFPLPQLGQLGPTSAIEAIGLTSTVGDRTMDYDLYVKLSKAAKPGPL